MPTTSTIVAIARDSALLRSLAFALEAHGYRVKAFRSWKAARDSACGARCVIIDGSLPLSDRNACLEILADGVRVVMLAEDETPSPQRHGLQVLYKPLSGSDVLGAVESLRTTP